MKWIKRIAIGLGVVYLLLCLMLFFAQEKIIFQPFPLEESHVFRAGEEVEVEVEPGIFLNGLWLRTPNPKGVILYLHGNRGHLRRCIYQAQSAMTMHGYDVFMMDYRGYGKSDGEVDSESQLLGDVDQVYEYVKGFYPENKIVVLGYSLGSGMATYLATKHSPQQLVLLAPYRSLYAIKNMRFSFIPDFLMKYQMNTEARIKEVNCPVTIFHGTKDEVIPYQHGQYLSTLSTKIKLVTLEGESHRGALFNDAFKRGLGELLH